MGLHDNLDIKTIKQIEHPLEYCIEFLNIHVDIENVYILELPDLGVGGSKCIIFK